MKKRWQKFEDQVREIATLIYGRPCQPKQIAGCDIDGFIELDEGQVVLFEITVNHTLRKVREDTTKLIQVRAALFSQGKFALCRIITDGVPTESMCQGGRSNNVDVWSFNELAAQFIEYENYRSARSDYPFGSSIDPQTGEIDRIKYVPVLYEDRNLKKSYSIKDIGEMIASGRQIVLLGEYGTGKSRCCSEVFEYIAKEWGITFLFPFAINLRECWGLEDAIELLRRHVRNLGLGRMEGSAVRAFNRRNLLFILDGFDEVGTQSWSIDDARLRQLRAKALVAIKDAITNSGNGTLITGREHYFSSQNEMFAALGLDPTRTLVLHVKEEFSLDEMLDYFRAANISVELPDWLPRRPLICQTISQLTDDDLEGMLGRGSEANFFNYFIRVVAKRDSRINASFDEETIHRVFLELAALTRVKSG